MLPRENQNFLNVRNTGFLHSEKLFVLLQMLSLQNLKEFFSDPPLSHKFFHAPHPPQIPGAPPPLPDVK